MKKTLIAATLILASNAMAGGISENKPILLPVLGAHLFQEVHTDIIMGHAFLIVDKKKGMVPIEMYAKSCLQHKLSKSCRAFFQLYDPAAKKLPYSSEMISTFKPMCSLYNVGFINDDNCNLMGVGYMDRPVPNTSDGEGYDF